MQTSLLSRLQLVIFNGEDIFKYKLNRVSINYSS